MSLLRPISTMVRAAAAPAVVRPSNQQAITAASSAVSVSGANTTPLTITTRSKHSARQTKRIFTQNPARLRIHGKIGNKDAKPKSPLFPIPDRTYPEIFQPTFLNNGWSAPPPPEVTVPEYPFRVARTGRKPYGAVGFLPVYRDVRIHGTKHTTIIRNVSGDINTFITELQAVLGLSLGKRGILTTSSSTGKHGGGEGGRGVNRENPIRIRAGGAIEVNGDHSREVKRWLAGLGF